LSEYAEAKHLQRENRPEDAVIKLKGAIQADPQFALAYASMGDVLVSLHRDLEGYAAYDKGLETGLENRLTRKEEDRIRGMRAVDTGEYEFAVDAFHDLAVNYPKDVIGWVYPTIPLRMLNRDEEAIANLRRAIALDPDAAFAPYSLAQELMIEGRLDEVPLWIEHLEKHNHPDYASEDEAILALLNHHYDDAARIYKSMESSTSAMRRSYGYQDLAGVEAETGHFSQAIDTLNSGIVEDKSQNNSAEEAAKLLGRAYLECRLQQFEDCLEDVHAGFELSPTPEDALLADTVLGDADSAAPSRFAPAIKHELGQIEHSLPGQEYGKLAMVVKLRTRGEIQLASGEPKAALQTFENAAVQDASAGSREYLARALVAVAAIESDEQAKANLLRKAQSAYAAIATKPSTVWCDLSGFPPGFYADEIAAFLSIPLRGGQPNPAVKHAAEELALLRGEKPVLHSASPYHSNPIETEH
jgi:tetratricopeptide (TPR) repeat protein